MTSTWETESFRNNLHGQRIFQSRHTEHFFSVIVAAVVRDRTIDCMFHFNSWICKSFAFLFYFFKLAGNAFVCRFMCVLHCILHGWRRLRRKRRKTTGEYVFIHWRSCMTIKIAWKTSRPPYSTLSMWCSYYLITALPIKMAIHKPQTHTHTDSYTHSTMEAIPFISFVVSFDVMRINPSYCHFHFLPHKVAVIRTHIAQKLFFIHADGSECWRKAFYC